MSATQEMYAKIRQAADNYAEFAKNKTPHDIWTLLHKHRCNQIIPIDDVWEYVEKYNADKMELFNLGKYMLLHCPALHQYVCENVPKKINDCSITENGYYVCSWLDVSCYCSTFVEAEIKVKKEYA